MVKYVMGLNGYFPVSQARLSIHDSKFFSTSTVYHRDTSAPSEITVNETILVKINKEMPMKAIFLHRNDDPVYYDKMKAQCTEFKKIITTLATKRPVPCENRQICAALSVLLPCYCSVQSYGCCSRFLFCWLSKHNNGMFYSRVSLSCAA